MSLYWHQLIGILGPLDSQKRDKSSFANPYYFTARRLDTETTLYYYRARYYKPKIGRFLQTDPVGYKDNMNLYAYVGNNPIILIDPQGMVSHPDVYKHFLGGMKSEYWKPMWGRHGNAFEHFNQEIYYPSLTAFGNAVSTIDPYLPSNRTCKIVQNISSGFLLLASGVGGIQKAGITAGQAFWNLGKMGVGFWSATVGTTQAIEHSLGAGNDAMNIPSTPLGVAGLLGGPKWSDRGDMASTLMFGDYSSWSGIGFTGIQAYGSTFNSYSPSNPNVRSSGYNSPLSSSGYNSPLLSGPK